MMGKKNKYTWLDFICDEPMLIFMLAGIATLIAVVVKEVYF
jgi:hypothetical protein